MRTRSVFLMAAAIALAPALTAMHASDLRGAKNDASKATAPARSTPNGAIGVRSTSVLGAAWNDDNSPIKGAHVQLRNVLTGRVEATAVANDSGQFTFDNIEGGTYVVELVTESGRMLTVGHPFTIAPGETVATFVRLGTKIPWIDSFFSNAAAAATSTAASQGITAIAPAARPVSAGR